MGTAVEQRADIELEQLVENDEELRCGWCKEVATHRFVLSCGHSGLIGPEHVRRVRGIDEWLGEAICKTCRQSVSLKSLFPI